MNQVKRSQPFHRNQSSIGGGNGSPLPNLSGLPHGWKREESMRPNGLSTGRTDVFYISPTGQKVRTKQEMQVLLGNNFDLGNFDWRSGRFIPVVRSTHQEENGDAPSSKIPRLEQSLVPFTRRANSIDTYKPVVIRSQPECKRTEAKHPQYDTAHQLFWEKRFVDKYAVDPETGESFKPLTLPRSIQNAGAPGYESPQIVQSLVHALSSKDSPVTGQEQSQASIEKNPCVSINPLQPMIKTFIVSDEDIRRQEARVKELRQKLENARKKLNPRYTSERYG